jgi:hypothetical protein
MKDDLHVNEITGPRFELALQRLQEGYPFIFDGVAFRLTDDGCLACDIQSSWQIDSLTDQRALDDFERGKSVLMHIVKNATDFAAIVDDKPVVYTIIDDYGMGCDQLCQLDGDALQWADGIPRP